jgi:hypothetical protein
MLAACVALTACEPRAGPPTAASVVVFEAEDWYRVRPEPEGRWRGVLERRPPPVGPNARAALHFALKTDAGTFAVYSAAVDRLLAPFVGLRVEASGKLIDLRSEGFGVELWIARITSSGEGH